MKTTIEDILNNKFRAAWQAENYSAKVTVYEILWMEDGAPVFQDASASVGPTPVSDTERAEVYLSGFVKWDGCTELDMGCPHWCGPDGYKRHIALLEYIYKRAHELMEREPEDPWDEE